MSVPFGRAAALLVAAVAVAACTSTSDAEEDVQTSSPAIASTTSPPTSSPPVVTEPALTTELATPTTAEVTPTEPTPTEPLQTEPPQTEPVPATTGPPKTPASTAAPAPADLVACAAAMPLRDRVALLVWPAVYASEWDNAVQTVANHQVGGVVLFPRGWGEDDVAPGLQRLDAAATRGLVIATDEEGGDVQRLSMLDPLSSQQTVSEQFDAGQARDLIENHGAFVAAAGVGMVLGPVVDVLPADGGAPPLNRSRFFTGGPDRVTEFGAAYVDGWLANGLTPVLKHYPGHGDASGDTHDVRGETPPLVELEQRDLAPYRALARTPTAVMVGHLTVPGWTDGVPATRSAAAVTYLRDTLGYHDALVMTDALGMQAVGLPEDRASVEAIKAGIDVVIFTLTGQTGAVIAAIEGAVNNGEVSEAQINASAARVLRELEPARRGC